jgi:hypothetical protein
MRQFEEYFDDPSYDDVEEEEDEDEREGFASMFFIGMDSSDKAGRKAKKIPGLIRKLIAEGEINPDPDREYNFRVGGGFNDKQTEKQTYFYLSVMKTEIDNPV